MAGTLVDPERSRGPDGPLIDGTGLMEMPGKLVVRTYAPARRWIILSIVALLAGLALYVMFELGRFTAGYDALQAAAQRDSLLQRIDKLERDERQLRVQVVAADQTRLAESQERAEVARTIAELQAQVAHDQQEMSFYRGLVAQSGQTVADTVHVQQFRIATLAGAQHFALRFSLNRTQKPEEAVNGTLGISVDGTRGGAASSMDLAALTGGKNELPFSFKYFATIEQSVTLPGDFKPERVTIEIRPGRKGMAPYRQTFLWTPEPAT